MIFVDGSNLLNQMGKHFKKNIDDSDPTREALDVCRKLIHSIEKKRTSILSGNATEYIVRRYWAGSYKTGNNNILDKYRTALWNLNFEPMLYPKENGKEKGVDMAVAMAMLTNAFHQNYDTGIIVSGDRDYVNLVKEVKRYGQVIIGAFFDKGLSPELKMVCDEFITLELEENDTALKKLRGLT